MAQIIPFRKLRLVPDPDSSIEVNYQYFLSLSKTDLMARQVSWREESGARTESDLVIGIAIHRALKAKANTEIFGQWAASVEAHLLSQLVALRAKELK